MSSVMFDNFYRLFELRHPRAAKEVDDKLHEFLRNIKDEAKNNS